jgi:hypothetical protein
MYTDGDNQYDVREFEPHLSLLQDVDVLKGFAEKKNVSTFRKAQSAIFNSMIGILFGTYYKDVNCSMKIYKKKVLDKIEIKSTSAFIDAEMIIKAKKKGYKIAQFPVTHYKREGGVASGSKPSVIGSTVKDMLKFRFGLL